MALFTGEPRPLPADLDRIGMDPSGVTSAIWRKKIVLMLAAVVVLTAAATAWPTHAEVPGCDDLVRRE